MSPKTQPAERFAGLSLAEQETTINIDRETRTACIYTSDTRVINKLDKLYERKCVHRNADGITAVEYQVPEKLVSFRKGIVTQQLTAEQRQKVKQRLQRGKEAKV